VARRDGAGHVQKLETVEMQPLLLKGSEQVLGGKRARRSLRQRRIGCAIIPRDGDSGVPPSAAHCDQELDRVAEALCLDADLPPPRSTVLWRLGRYTTSAIFRPLEAAWPFNSPGAWSYTPGHKEWRKWARLFPAPNPASGS
jgi:hypothetical protein